MKKAKWLCTAAAVLALSAVVAGCGGDEKKEAAKTGGPSGEVMVYTSIYPDIIDNVCKPAMSKVFPDMKVDWFQGGTEKVMTKMAGEIKAKKIGADVLMVAEPSYYLSLKNDGLLLDYASPNLKDVITDKDEKGAMLSGTAFVAVAALADKYGWEYFDQLKANGMRVEEGNSAIQNKLLTGEYAAAMILEENILKLAATKNEPLKVVYPEDGVVIIPSPIAIFNTTKNADGAKAMVDWWLSKEGQQAVVQGWMHSVRGDVEPPKGAPALKTFSENAVPVDWQKLADNKAEIKEEFRVRVME